MPPVGFESIIAAGERPKTYVLDSAATGTGSFFLLARFKIKNLGRICQNISAVELSFFFLWTFTSWLYDCDELSHVPNKLLKAKQ
jgi:hypothetical protein